MNFQAKVHRATRLTVRYMSGRQSDTHVTHVLARVRGRQEKTTLLLWLPGIASYLRSVDVCHSKTKVMKSDKQRAQKPVSAIFTDFQKNSQSNQTDIQ